MVQKSVYRINLNNIDGEGEFPCPSCGMIISPDDDSGETYDTVDMVERGGSLRELSIICKKCKSIIHIEGFEALEELDKFGETPELNK